MRQKRKKKGIHIHVLEKHLKSSYFLLYGQIKISGWKRNNEIFTTKFNLIFRVNNISNNCQSQ